MWDARSRQSAAVERKISRNACGVWDHGLPQVSRAFVLSLAMHASEHARLLQPQPSLPSVQVHRRPALG